MTLFADLSGDTNQVLTTTGRSPDPCVTLNTVVGFTHRSLRAQVSALLGTPYTRNQMSYDLARLRTNRIIERLPHTNTYVLTADGHRVAIFYRHYCLGAQLARTGTTIAFGRHALTA